MKLSQIRSETRAVSIEYAGETIKISYRPSAITADSVMRAQDAGVEQLADFLVTAIAGWDIIDDDEAAWPVTRDNLMALPLSLVAAITESIVSDASPNPTKRAG